MITQLYEIQTPEEAGRCIALDADHIGSVIVSKHNWKQPMVREVVRETRKAKRKHSLIPLYNSTDVVSKTLDYYQPDIVHFCDSLVDATGKILPPGTFIKLQNQLREEFPDIQIMRSIPVRLSGSKFDLPTLEIAQLYEAVSDWFLIDTWVGHEKPDGFIGITGQVVDWDVAAKLVSRCRIPVILAGGLSPDNVYDAIMRVKPAGVDSCTRTNASGENGKPVRFKKDYLKVEEFVSEARRAKA